MKDRRPLSEGLKPPAPPVDLETARRFIHAEKLSAETGEGGQPVAPKQSPSATQNLSRRPDQHANSRRLCRGFETCSLERQLNGTEPNTLQDILEEAIEPWLKNNGYIAMTYSDRGGEGGHLGQRQFLLPARTLQVIRSDERQSVAVEHEPDVDEEQRRRWDCGRGIPFRAVPARPAGRCGRSCRGPSPRTG